MKNVLFLLLILCSTSSFSQQYAIKTDGASVNFNFISKKTTGTISDVNASISINKEALQKSVVMGSVQVKNLTTENKGRDEHLMSSDFFDAEKHPEMKFVSSNFEISGGAFIAHGALTIKDITQDVIFNISEEKGSLVFNTSIYSSDFDINIKKDREENKIDVSVIVPYSK